MPKTTQPLMARQLWFMVGMLSKARLQQLKSNNFYLGWGKTSYGGSSDVLQEAEVTVVSKYLCLGTMLYELGEVITDDMICAAGNGTDSCQVKTTVYSAVERA